MPALESLEPRLLLSADLIDAQSPGLLETTAGDQVVTVNLLDADQQTTPVTEAVTPLPAQNLRITSDTGLSATDGVTNRLSVVLAGHLPEVGQSVALRDMTAGTDLGSAVISGSDFTAALTFTTSGQHLIRVRNTAAGGLYSDSFFNLVIDQADPTVAAVSPLFGTSGTVGFSIEFSENTNIAALISSGSIRSAVSLLRVTDTGATAVNLSGGAFTYNESTHVLEWRASGGSALAEGRYRVVVHPGYIVDAAGNTMVGGGEAFQLGAEQHVKAGGIDVQVTGYSIPTLADWNNDSRPDLIVGEKFDASSGRVRVYLNTGTAAAPVYGTFFYVQAAGADLVVPAAGCQGAFPRVADWNRDSKNDLLIGLTDGTIRVYLNTGTNANPTFAGSSLVQVGDAGAKVNLDVGDRATFEVVDWNNDGAMDLVVGALDGKVRVYLNRRTTGEPDLASAAVVQEGASDLAVPSGRSAVDVCDFNGDGRKDLLLGNTDAQLVFYPNVGTDAAPVFAEHQVVLGPTGTSRTRPFVADINGDGTVDILLGSLDGLVRQYFCATTSTDFQAEFTTAKTAGYTTVFPNVSEVANRRAIPVVAGQTGNLESVSIYHEGGSGHAILAVYSDASGLPGNLLGITNSTLINSTAGWQTIGLKSPVAVTAGQTVWLAWVFEIDPGMRWTPGLPGRASSAATWSGGMPTSFGVCTTSTGLYSIYANYGAGGADVTAPGIVGSLNAAPGNGQVNLTWTNPSDADFAGVKILRKTGGSPTGPTDGTVVYAGANNHFTDSGLTNGTTYYYAIFSYDEVPNYSSAATVNGTPTSGAVTTTVGYTTVFPNISAVSNRRATPVVTSQAGTLESISIYHEGGSGHAVLAVYSDASGLPGTLLGITNSTLINSAAGWQTIGLKSPVTVSAGQTIWLAWVFEIDPGMRWTPGLPGRAISSAAWSGGMPTSFGASSTSTGQYSIYATYAGSGADVTAPGVVANLNASAGNGQVNLTWTNPSDADFAGVKIVRKTGSNPTGPTDGTTVYTGADTHFTDSGLTNGTTYYYAVFSYDEVPNYSAGATASGTPVAGTTSTTVGYTTVFSNISAVSNRRAVPVVTSQAGTLASISIYHEGGTGHAILAVYSDASGLPGNLLGTTNSTLINASAGWQKIALTSPVTVTAGQTIWLAWVFENDPGMRWTPGLPGRAISTATWSSGMPTSFGASSTTTGQYSIYATYGDSSQPSNEVIVDNADAGTSSIGVWYASSRSGPWGANSMTSTGEGSTFTFSADLEPGTAYAVYSWWTSGPLRYTTVPYAIRSGSTLLGSVTINQTLNGSQWNLLGVYTFTGKASVTLTADPNSTASVNADAVRFVPVTLESIEIIGPTSVNENSTANYQAVGHYSGGVTAAIRPQSWSVNVPQATINSTGSLVAGAVNANTLAVITAQYTLNGVAKNDTHNITILNGGTAPAEVIVDNSSATSTGNWYASGAPNPYGADSMVSWTPGSTFTFNGNLTSGTRYAVYAWWTQSSCRYTQVPYEIRNGSALLATVAVDQTVNGGQWNLLGTYTFTDAASVKVLAAPSSAWSANADAVRFVPVT
jgi:hypothetical protein